MRRVEDIAEVYALDCASPVQVPAWAGLPQRIGANGRRRADGWGVRVVCATYVGPERRAVPREPVLRVHGRGVLPREAGWLFAARGRA
jgi:hypothetical protein